MLSIIASVLSAAAFSFAASLPGPLQRSKDVTGSGFIALPMTVVHKNVSTLHKRQDGTPLYNHDAGVSYLVHRKYLSHLLTQKFDILQYQ